MANLNKVMLIGRLTRDPEEIPLRSGGRGAKFGFAVNNRKLNQETQQWEDDPVFLDTEIFNRGENGKQADRVLQTLRKGNQIFIEGHLRLAQWVTKETNEKRNKLVVVIENFQYLEPRAEGTGGDMTPRTQRATPAPKAQPYRGEETESAGAPASAVDDDIPF